MEEVLRTAARDRGGLSLLAWGLISAAAFTAAYASWQYTPTRSARATAPDTVNVTASIPVQTPRVLEEVPRPAPVQPRATPATPDAARLLRELEELKDEIRDLRRIVDRVDMSGEQVGRRMDALEDQGAVLSRRIEVGLDQARAAAQPAPAPTQIAASLPQATTSAQKSQPAAPVAPPPAKLAEAAPPPAAPARTLDAALMEPRPMRVTTRSYPPDAQPSQTLDEPARTKVVPVQTTTVSEPDAAKTAPQAPAPVQAPPAAAEPPAGRLPTVAISAKPSATAANQLAPTPQQAQLAALAAQIQSQSNLKPASAPEKTASIPMTTPDAAAAPGGFAVDLGGFRSVTQLRKAWSDTGVKHAPLIKALTPLAQIKETDDGVEARLVAGPFATALDAGKFCAQVKAAGTSCAPSMYVGQPIQPATPQAK